MINRIKFLDVSKGLLIILMVIGHSESPVTSYIYLFHMSAFVFISGYTFNQKYPLKTALKKRFQRLYIPFIKYSLVFLLFYNVFVLMNFYDAEEMIWSPILYIKSILNILLLGGALFGSGLLGAFWFLTMLFEISIIYLIINSVAVKYLKSSNIMATSIVIIFILGNILILIDYNLPRFLDNSLVMILIYHFGVLYKKFENRIPIKLYFALFSALSLIILNQYGSIDVGLNIYTNPLYFLFASLTGIYLIIYISKTLVKFYECKFLNFLGKNTLVILALQFLCFKFVNLIIICTYSYPIQMMSSFPTINLDSSYWWLLYSLVGLVMPIIIYKIYESIFKQKIKRLN